MRTPPNERVSSDISDGTKARNASEPDKTRPEKKGPARKVPERRCILSGENDARDGLIRLAISPDGDVWPDVLARAPGRGAWIGVSRAELGKAMEKGQLRGALARAFKGAPMTVPDALPQMIADALTKAFLSRLGLEMRSGRLILGSDRIAERARSGLLPILMHAADAREDGARKLDQAWRVGNEIEGSGARGIRLPLDRAALSVALGRENVVHLGVESRKAAERVNQTLERLMHFVGTPEGAPNAGGGDTPATDETI